MRTSRWRGLDRRGWRLAAYSLVLLWAFSWFYVGAMIITRSWWAIWHFFFGWACLAVATEIWVRKVLR